MDVEAGASRYALTVAVYLTAVTIYAVCQSRAFLPLNLGETRLGGGEWESIVTSEWANPRVDEQIRLPEAWRPGKFDIWGHSHQIFHVLMAVGLTLHFSAFAKAFDYAKRVKQC